MEIGKSFNSAGSEVRAGRLVAITRVKNEADIIEPFLRHTAAHVDTILVLDHASSDDTVSIIERLIDEGLPIEIEVSSLLQSQGADMTRMMRDAVARLNASWIIPLDADEFIETNEGTTLKDWLPPNPQKPISVYWRNFAYEPASQAYAGSAIHRLHRRSTKPSELPKIMVPASLAREADVEIYEGNHSLMRGGTNLDADRCEGVVLAHFPIRSRQQYAAKVLIGTYRYIINHAGDTNTWGWHYQTDYQLIIANKFDALEQRMMRWSLGYSEADQENESVVQPLHYLGGPLRYTHTELDADLIRILAVYSETIARELATCRDTLNAPRRQGFFAKLARSYLRLPPEP